MRRNADFFLAANLDGDRFILAIEVAFGSEHIKRILQLFQGDSTSFCNAAKRICMQ